MRAAIALALGLIILSTAFALPNPGILPDSPFYGLKKFFEKINLAFTFSDKAKAEKYLHYAELRLAEAKAMVQANKTEIAKKLMEEYAKNINQSEKIAAKVNKTEVVEKIINATERHLDVLQGVYDKVPDQAKPAIEHAIAIAELKEERLLEVLENINGTKALKLRIGIVNRSVNKAKVCLETNNTKCLKMYMHHYQRCLNKTNELAGKLNTTEIYELVANATFKHIKVLEKVKEKVPEEAQDAIEKAINVSQKGYEIAKEAVEKRGGHFINQTMGAQNQTINQSRRENHQHMP